MADNADSRRTILALDLGSNTGWALGSDSRAVVYGTENFTPGRFDSSAMRFVRFRAWLERMLVDGGVCHVVYEEVRRHVGTDAAHVYGGLLGHLLEMTERAGVPAEGYSVGAIKKAWTGRGNADKAAMVAQAQAMGFAPPDDNCADALAIFHMAIGEAPH